MTGNPTAPTATSDPTGAAANAATAAADAAEQPYRDLGLTDDEYGRIVATLGRRPTDAELAMYSVMWSEHCSYKSSKIHLRQFKDTPSTDRLLVGMGENAGVVAVGEGLAVTFKIESHNHPSFVEPYQGAATGVGGIVRDILTMGARPLAVLDPLRFGDADAPDTARTLPGIVAGIGGYGNCLGLPNIGGEVVFDPTYAGNPLVNALCVGVMPVSRVQTSAATGVGNAVVLLGAKTGRDGIGGVSVLASATFDEGGGPARRPSVQVGDPFTEKILIESCLELFDRGLVTGIQDLGGAGLTCALTETTAAGIATGQPGGMDVDLELVPLREASMSPPEVLASESQERMLAIVTPQSLPEVLALAERWGVIATRIGTVTDSGRLVIRWHGEVVVDVPPGSLADDGPVYERPIRRPADLDLVRADTPAAARLARPTTGEQLRETLLRLIASPNLCSRAWVTDQYDRYVQANTVLAQPEDAGVLRLSADTGLGIALATDGNGRYARLDPFAGAQLALAEACRNVSAAGAEPIAVTNCLNFGSPEDPEVMWQFAEACAGLADGCRRLGLPVTGGNVSFYNQTGATPIHPTPVIGVLGLFDDVARRTPIGFTGDGDALILLGETADEFGGSEWAWVTHRHLGGAPPAVDLAREKLLGEVLVAGSREGLLSAAHDLSDGGLAQTLVESCLRGGRGARIELAAGADLFVELFSESTARAVVAVPSAAQARFAELCTTRGLPWQRLGVVGGDTLDVRDAFAVGLDELRTAHEGTLPALFGQTT
ncbi:phosphoribosylformylglycinamidine synthase subunit PurL [Frankia sp. AgB32]|uniref:phosphoribosylformylglycinamidine synthase subunit PurL n=1 Tax=Frankia sp. AgB32 TaxID=631119 RepID=UPI00200FAB50|nr:phosphoribosylformylglycinamidine synthase subunit PurL [Frankia sp. AgB32]MCK9893176.1 phosphoribosylformylglycinamidine synthase subunit PurL [Frankia sp. AgB32]